MHDLNVGSPAGQNLFFNASTLSAVRSFPKLRFWNRLEHRLCRQSKRDCDAVRVLGSNAASVGRHGHRHGAALVRRKKTAASVPVIVTDNLARSQEASSPVRVTIRCVLNTLLLPFFGSAMYDSLRIPPLWIVVVTL